MGQEILQNKITTKFGSILQRATAFLLLSVHFKYNCCKYFFGRILFQGNRKYLVSTELQKELAINTRSFPPIFLITEILDRLSVTVLLSNCRKHCNKTESCKTGKCWLKGSWNKSPSQIISEWRLVSPTGRPLMVFLLSHRKNWTRNLICKLIASPASDKYGVPAF